VGRETNKKEQNPRRRRFQSLGVTLS